MADKWTEDDKEQWKWCLEYGQLMKRKREQWDKFKQSLKEAVENFIVWFKM